jgi:Flp pilus assembly protein TadG
MTFAHLCKRLAGDRSGAVAIIFAFALLPLTIAVGAAVDYSRASAAKARLDALADLAVVTAVSKDHFHAMRAMPDSGEAQIRTIFENHARTIPDLTLGTTTVVVQQTTASRDVTLTYQASIRNFFSNFLNAPTTAIAGTAASTASMPIFMDFYLMLDNSPSMGIGATLADMARMENNTPDRCAFACHEAWRPGADYYALAKSLGVKLRIDLVREATQRLMDTAVTTRASPDQFRVAIYTFNMGVQQISPMTSDMTAAKSAAGGIDLVTLPSPNHNGYRYTNFSGLAPAASALPYGGTGLSSSSPRTVLFLVSDGVADEWGPPRVKPVPVALCDQIKARNIQIAALYTTYHPLPTNAAYMAEVAPVASQIAPAMQQCASPGLYFEVSPSQGISEAMQALFLKAVGQARLAR